jgi:hypothetical protein
VAIENACTGAAKRLEKIFSAPQFAARGAAKKRTRPFKHFSFRKSIALLCYSFWSCARWCHPLKKSATKRLQSH